MVGVQLGSEKIASWIVSLVAVSIEDVVAEWPGASWVLEISARRGPMD
jgi:hypothetical protein